MCACVNWLTSVLPYKVFIIIHNSYHFGLCAWNISSSFLHRYIVLAVIPGHVFVSAWLWKTLCTLFQLLPWVYMSRSSVADPGSFANAMSLTLHNELRCVREQAVLGARYQHRPSQGVTRSWRTRLTRRWLRLAEAARRAERPLHAMHAQTLSGCLPPPQGVRRNTHTHSLLLNLYGWHTQIPPVIKAQRFFSPPSLQYLGAFLFPYVLLVTGWYGAIVSKQTPTREKNP